MQAIIPLAGLGTRLRPHTHTKPKPLVTVAGKPILGHVLDTLSGLPIDEIIFIVGYLGDQIEKYVRATYAFQAIFVEQKELKGQAHAIALAREHVRDDVLIIFGDSIIGADFSGLGQSNSDGVVYVKEIDDPRRFGVVTLDDDHITRFVEKPSEPISHLAVAGVYYIKDHSLLFRAIDDLLARNIQLKGEFFLADALQLMVDAGARLEARPVTMWVDCGTADSLLETNRYLLRKTVTDGKSGADYIVIPPVSIAPTATLRASIVGPYVFVGERSSILGSVVGPDVSLADDAEIVNSIVKDSVINAGAKIEDAMLASSLIGDNARVRGAFERLNVGDSSEVDSSLKSHVPGLTSGT